MPKSILFPLQFNCKNGFKSSLFYGLIVICLFWSNKVFGQDFKVIGYLPHYRMSQLENIQMDKITHLNIAFANPNADGDLSFQNVDVTPAISEAHANNISVFISLAGGALTNEWAAAWKELIKPQNRTTFIQKIIDYTLFYEFDGIDLDLEWSHVDDNYSGFVLALRSAINNTELGFTAALPGTYRYPDISDAAMLSFDWINMMVYDLRGPWAPNDPGPHSPYSFAVSSLNYWVGQGMAKNKLTLGVPFYGYDFTDPNNVFARTYSNIVGMNTNNAFVDKSGAIYYNGIPTIEAKTEFALDEVSGIMIWELSQDRHDEFSLLSHIDEIVSGTISSTQNTFAESVNIYPNPFSNQLNIHFDTPFKGHLEILNDHGQSLYTQNILATDLVNLGELAFPSGSYIIQIITDRQVFSKKLIKIRS